MTKDEAERMMSDACMLEQRWEGSAPFTSRDAQDAWYDAQNYVRDATAALRAGAERGLYEYTPHRMLAAKIERDMSAEMERTLGRLASREAVVEIRRCIIGMLLAYRNAGDIPSDFDFAATSVTTEESTLAVTLPVRLRLFLDHGPEALRPHYPHDCEACRFLGHAWGSDLYFCDKQATGSTVIARQSSVPSQYTSGLEIALGESENHPLRIAADLAREAGLL